MVRLKERYFKFLVEFEDVLDKIIDKKINVFYKYFYLVVCWVEFELRR